jgi:hemoglobin-like flavoprotein
MTPEQKKLVRSTFTQLLPQAESLIGLFYRRLFELDPTMRLLFKIDIHMQERKLLDMLIVAIMGLDNMNQLASALQRMGVRHKAYGVEAEHYDTLWLALHYMLEQGLGERFTAETCEAWETLYRLMATTMQEVPEL